MYVKTFPLTHNRECKARNDVLHSIIPSMGIIKELQDHGVKSLDSLNANQENLLAVALCFWLLS
jgi:hypothetical protein